MSSLFYLCCNNILVIIVCVVSGVNYLCSDKETRNLLGQLQVSTQAL